MRIKARLFRLLLLFLSFPLFIQAAQPKMELWYSKPAVEWMTSALPIGNGELGAMFFGSVNREQIQFNEKTLWTGHTNLRGAYQNFGDLFIEFPDHIDYQNYCRKLNLDSALGSVRYTANNTEYLREYFASNPDSVIVMRLTTPKSKGKISLDISLKDAHGKLSLVRENQISFSGKLDILSYQAQIKVLNEGGSISGNDQKISVRNADAITILLTAATNYSISSSDYIGQTTEELYNRLSKRIEHAAKKTYNELKTAHLNDYQPKFNKVKLDLNAEMPQIPTDVLLKSFKESTYLDILYFQYGRYLMLSSSRGMGLPNNLQGIWNNDNNPGWQCDIHSNINIQMNYWPAEVTNLSECHTPFLNYIAKEALRPGGSWQKIARDEGLRGWSLKTQTNIFAYTDWNINRPVNAWYSMHLWQHYIFTHDLDYLRRTAYPVMKAACEYWFDRLKEVDGKLIAPNEWSPEQGPWEDGVAYAQQLVWNLFNTTLKAALLVETDKAFMNELSDKLQKTDNGLSIGSWGQVKEWKYDTKNLDVWGNDHRHLSHLIALYPGDQVSYRIDSVYANAAKTTLLSRGDDGTGWSRAWKIACWARLYDGDHALKLLKQALNMARLTVISMDNSEGGVYENLLDAHPPFQIDGNFGATAGIAEMLLQSNHGDIHILPALPSVWPTGSFQGLRAQGNFTVDLKWVNSKPVECSILSLSGGKCKLYFPDIQILEVRNENNQIVKFEKLGNNQISFDTRKNGEYRIIFLPPSVRKSDILESAKAPKSKAGKPVRLKENINREWKFTLGDVTEAKNAGFNDTRWTNVSLPHSFSMPYFMWDKVYQGYGWYRKQIDVPKEWLSKNITIEFEGSFIETEVFVNGSFAGKNVGGYTGFAFDITKYLKAGSNTVAVRVNNHWKPDVAPRAGDHQFNGGIYRDVYLNVTDKLHVDWYGTFVSTPVVSSKSAICKVETEVRNNYEVAKECVVYTEIKSPNSKTVAEQNSKQIVKPNEVAVFKQMLPEIINPELWSPESPVLYKAYTTIAVDGKVVDTYETTFGIRSFQWTADKGFFLNGEHYYLLGANVHQDQAGWGDAVTNAAMRRDVKMMKDAGFNCIRGSHYPHDPAFVEACDELGVIFFSENALWGMGGGSGDRDGWGPPSSSCYPPDKKHQADFDKSVLYQLKKMIRVHRNSASVAAWSLSNEPFFTDSSTDKAMKNLLNMATDSARYWDPSREVAVGGAQRKGVDVLGKKTLAFYNGDGASRDEFQNPGVPNLVSEYGSTTSHRPGKFFAGWGDILKAPAGNNDPWSPPVWRSGHIIWCGFDHGTIGGVGLATMGLVDYFRLPKRQYFWYVEAFKKGNKNPVEPEWPKQGVPAKLKFETTNTVINGTNGTDDAQLIVTILDAAGKHISNNIPVELSIVTGPGEFPTGRTIKFMPPSADEASDIFIRDGQAAIAFRSYYGGKTRIKASADGLEPVYLVIETKGKPVWREKFASQMVNRPYKRYNVATELPQQDADEMLLATYRPSWVSSTLRGTNKANVNDDDVKTVWKPAVDDKERWWKLALEASYCVNKIELEFPESGQYDYSIEVSENDTDWKEVVRSKPGDAVSKVRLHKGDFGCNVAFVRVRFYSNLAGLAEVRVGGQAVDNTLHANSKLVTYPAPEKAELNKKFLVRVKTEQSKWKDIDVYNVKVKKSSGLKQSIENSSMTYFDFSGNVEVLITCDTEDIKDVRIRPLSNNISPVIKGNTIRFKLDKPRKLSIEVNGDIFQNLQLFANEIEKEVPKSTDKDVIFFGPGIHEIKGEVLYVPTGKTVYLSGGAILNARVIFDKVTDARLIGRGMINQSLGSGIKIEDSKNIQVEGVFATQCFTGGSDGVTIKNVKTMSFSQWGDGMNVISSNNVVFDDVFNRNSDDCTTVYGTRGKFVGGCKNIIMKNSVLWADVAHPILIGTHGNSSAPDTLQNLIYENIDILDHNEMQQDYQGCLSINTGDNNLVKNVIFRDIRVEDFRKGQLINLRVFFNSKYCTAPGQNIENVLFENIVYDGVNAGTSIISGYDQFRKISDITFKGLKVNGTIISDDMDGKPGYYKTSDMTGFYIGEHVENVKFEK